MSVQIARRAFSVTDYYRMTESGILSEADRVELLDGEVIEMSPIGSRHAGAVNRLTELLIRLLAGSAVVAVQNPIRLDDYSEPQPDLTVSRARADYYTESHPTPDDVLLVIEVADTSVEFDRAVKLPLYATAQLPEVWIVNLLEDCVEVYSQPANDGYQKSQTFTRGEALAAHTIPNLTLKVDTILG